MYFPSSLRYPPSSKFVPTSDLAAAPVSVQLLGFVIRPRFDCCRGCRNGSCMGLQSKQAWVLAGQNENWDYIDLSITASTVDVICFLSVFVNVNRAHARSTFSHLFCRRIRTNLIICFSVDINREFSSILAHTNMDVQPILGGYWLKFLSRVVTGRSLLLFEAYPAEMHSST